MKPIKVAIVVLLTVVAALLGSRSGSVTVAPGESVTHIAPRARAGTTVVLPGPERRASRVNPSADPGSR